MRGLLVATLALTALAGCTHMGNVEGEWQCPMPGGASCQPIEKADPYVNGGADSGAVQKKDGELPAPALTPAKTKTGEAQAAPAAAPAAPSPGAANGSAATASNSDPVPVVKSEPRAVVGTGMMQGAARTGEEIAKVWVFPFVDKAGNFHEGEYVDVVVRPSTWVE